LAFRRIAFLDQSNLNRRNVMTSRWNVFALFARLAEFT
jgi:hypothetical protein